MVEIVTSKDRRLKGHELNHLDGGFFYFLYPKGHWTLKTGYFEDQNTPAMQVQNLPLEGPMILRGGSFFRIFVPKFVQFFL